MTRSTSRVLALLEILEGGGQHTVPELARRLAVDERTVRRYVGHLLDIDVPVTSTRGRYGGYRLAAGYRVPPLMLTDEEALAVLLGLVVGRRSGIATATAEAGDTAAGKIRRVLPVDTARRLDALLETLDWTTPPAQVTGADAGTLLLLATAARDRRPVVIDYRSRDGRHSERTIHPYGIVAHHGRWYVTGHDGTSGQVRTFRLDRIERPALRPGGFETPEGFQPAAAVLKSLATTPWRHDVRVVVEASAEVVRAQLPPGLARVQPVGADPDRSRIELRAEHLEWIPALLVGLQRPFTIEQPAELRELVRSLAGRLLSYGAEPDES